MPQLTCALHEGHEALVLDDLVSTVHGALIPDSLNRGHHHTTTDGVDGVAQQTSADGHSWNQQSWWRHQMETFSALQTIYAGKPPVPGEFPAQRPVTRMFDIFFDLRPNKRLSIQWWGWWIETPSRSLWRHCNDTTTWRDFMGQG